MKRPDSSTYDYITHIKGICIYYQIVFDSVEALPTHFYDLVSQINKLPQQVLNADENLKYEVEIKVVKLENDKILKSFKKVKRPKLSLWFKFMQSHKNALDMTSQSSQTQFSWYHQFYCEYFVRSFLLLTNVSHFAALNLSKGKLFIDGKLFGSVENHLKDIQWGYEALIEDGKWPQYESGDLETIIKYKGEIMSFKNSENKIERALYAFHRTIFADSHTLDDTEIELLYSMMGLEALYCEGETSIVSQIKNKYCSLFNAPKEIEKIISDMYQKRSRFFHGNIDLTPDIQIDWDGENPPKSKISDFARIGIIMLANTLKHIMMNNIKEFTFKYKLEK